MAINITLIIIISSVSLLGMILGYLLLRNLSFYHRWRHHVQCILTVPFGNSFKIVKIKWVVQTMRTFDDKSGKKPHTYNLNLEKSIFSKSNNPILYYDINKTEPIDFVKKGKGESSNMYHNVLHDKSAEEVLSKDQNKSMLLIIMILVVIIAGVGIFAQYQLSQANDKIIVLTKYIAEVMANTTKTGGIIVK